MKDPDFEDCPGQPESCRPDFTHTANDEQRLLEYLEGELPASENRALEEHLGVCAECQTLAEQWRQLDSHLQAQFSSAETPAGVSATGLERHRKRRYAGLSSKTVPTNVFFGS